MLAYISFDSVPAPKGASTHIAAFASGLAARFGAVELVTASTSMAATAMVERWPGVRHFELPAVGKSLIDRVLCFRRFLRFWLEGRRLEVVQFRSIFEGLPLLSLAPRPKLIFEVNGLPSIELKYRYPKMRDDRELMGKLLAQEQACLEAADRIVTPSGVTASYLAGERGVEASKIRVIPNGVDTELFRPRDGCDPGPLVYFGTLSAWQGVETAVRAVAQTEMMLDVFATGSASQQETVRALAAKLGAGERVRVHAPVPQCELAGHLARATAVLAPLAMNDRNVKQGCCPLKVLEGMACGVPVIASDLPVVRELGCDGVHFVLVKPGSVEQIVGAIERIAADGELRRRIGAAARARVEANYRGSGRWRCWPASTTRSGSRSRVRSGAPEHAKQRERSRTAWPGVW